MTEAVNAQVAHEQTLFPKYQKIREFTETIIAPLSPEDCMVQSMDDVSPTRWHIAHTTWFFETFVLKPINGYQEYDPQFNYLFNSYYNSIGKQFPRPQRGFVSRPGLDEIKNYRRYVDQHMTKMLQDNNLPSDVSKVVEVGLHHEQQHQELMLTDIKHVLSCNPMTPKYTDYSFDDTAATTKQWIGIEEGIYEAGYSGSQFSFDNESPVHKTFVNDCQVSKDLVTCGQYIEFIENGGYQKPEHWLAMGWSAVNEHGWDAPLYWIKQDQQWFQFTLAGLVPVDPDWPVCHVSYFEADAFARWSGKRLPTEFEWEIANSKVNQTVKKQPFADHLFQNERAIHPTRSPNGLMGCVWQWTSSSYAAYPGYRPPAGAIGEYNGKFMCNQYVLRGGSVATSSNHIRPTYRNFFPPDSRWQFFGIRLAQ